MRVRNQITIKPEGLTYVLYRQSTVAAAAAIPFVLVSRYLWELLIVRTLALVVWSRQHYSPSLLGELRIRFPFRLRTQKEKENTNDATRLLRWFRLIRSGEHIPLWPDGSVSHATVYTDAGALYPSNKLITSGMLHDLRRYSGPIAGLPAVVEVRLPLLPLVDKIPISTPPLTRFFFEILRRTFPNKQATTRRDDKKEVHKWPFDHHEDASPRPSLRDVVADVFELSSAYEMVRLRLSVRVDLADDQTKGDFMASLHDFHLKTKGRLSVRNAEASLQTLLSFCPQGVCFVELWMALYLAS